MAEEKELEYAIRRTKDGAYLFDADADGRDVNWEYDEDSAVWFVDREHALANATLNGLADDDGKLNDGIEIVSREITYEEDYEDDDDPNVIPW